MLLRQFHIFYNMNRGGKEFFSPVTHRFQENLAADVEGIWLLQKSQPTPAAIELGNQRILAVPLID